jgi:hypothetical protein
MDAIGFALPLRMSRAGFKKRGGGATGTVTSGPPQNANRIHRFYCDICFYNITKSWFVFLVIRNKEGGKNFRNLNLLLLTGVSTFWLPQRSTLRMRNAPYSVHLESGCPDRSSMVFFHFFVQVPVEYLKIGHDCFLPRLSEFDIGFSSYNFTLHSLSNWSCL